MPLTSDADLTPYARALDGLDREACAVLQIPMSRCSGKNDDDEDSWQKNQTNRIQPRDMTVSPQMTSWVKLSDTHPKAITPPKVPLAR